MQPLSCASRCVRLGDTPQKKVVLISCAALTLVLETLALLSFLGVLHGINTIGASCLAGAGILILPITILLLAVASRRNLTNPQTTPTCPPAGKENLIDKLPNNMLQKVFEYNAEHNLRVVCKKWKKVMDERPLLEVSCLYNKCISESERLYAERIMPLYEKNLRKGWFRLRNQDYGDSCQWADILGKVAVAQAYTSPQTAKETAARMYRPTKWMKAEALCQIAEIDKEDDYKDVIEAVKQITDDAETQAEFLCRIIKGQLSRNFVAEAKETLLLFQELPETSFQQHEFEAKCAIAQSEKDNGAFSDLMEWALHQDEYTRGHIHLIPKYQATVDVVAAKEKAERLEPEQRAKALCAIAAVEARNNIPAAKETASKIVKQVGVGFVMERRIGKYERVEALYEIAKGEGDFQEVLNETTHLKDVKEQDALYKRIALAQVKTNVVDGKKTVSVEEAKKTALLIKNPCCRTEVLSTLGRIEQRNDFKLAIESALMIPERTVIPDSQAIMLSHIAADQAWTHPKVAQETMKLALAKCPDELVRIHALSVFAEGLAQVMTFYRKRKD